MDDPIRRPNEHYAKRLYLSTKSKDYENKLEN